MTDDEKGIGTGGNWKAVLIDRAFSLPAIGFYIIVLGAVAHKLDVGIFGNIGDIFVRIINAIQRH